MIRSSAFEPCRWGKNRHLQTLLPPLLRNGSSLSFIHRRLDTSDGDFLDLAWSALPVGNDTTPIVLIFHGLEGSIDSHYIKGMFQAVRKAGWIAVLMHFRGCSGEPNRTARRYHSGETEDAAFVIHHIKKKVPNAPLFALGYSLGGNMLLKYLGEQGRNHHLRAAAAVSVPFDLGLCVSMLETGLSRIYHRHLLTELKQNTLAKIASVDHSETITLSARQLETLKSIRAFDEHVTAPIHGFKGADDYYQQCSSRQFLHRITCPTLIIHARDDPFVDSSSIPDKHELSDSVVLEISDHGGHVGFISGSCLSSPRFWLEERVPEYFKKSLRYKFD